MRSIRFDDLSCLKAVLCHSCSVVKFLSQLTGNDIRKELVVIDN